MEAKRNIEQRDYRYDTWKAMLICLVVLGHLMEQFNKGIIYDLYRIIYTFHMPAFIYISGRFTKFNPKKTVRHLLIPYLIFQTLYLFFDAVVISGEAITLQYTKPYWILWYLLALIFYQMVIQFLPDRKSRKALWVIAGSVIVALLAGADQSLGYYLSLSRVVVFAPFFLLGYYSEYLRGIVFQIKEKRQRLIISMISIIAIIVGEYYVIINDISKKLLYGSYSYAGSDSHFYDRLIVMIIAGCFIVLAENILPKEHIPIVSSLGQNTITVFLLHGFIVRLIAKSNWLDGTAGVNMLIAMVITILIVMVLGNNLVTKILKMII